MKLISLFVLMSFSSFSQILIQVNRSEASSQVVKSFNLVEGSKARDLSEIISHKKSQRILLQDLRVLENFLVENMITPDVDQMSCLDELKIKEGFNVKNLNYKVEVQIKDNPNSDQTQISLYIISSKRDGSREEFAPVYTSPKAYNKNIKLESGFLESLYNVRVLKNAVDYATEKMMCR